MAISRYRVRWRQMRGFRGLLTCIALNGCASAAPAPASTHTSQARAAFLRDSIPPLIAAIRLGDSTAHLRTILGAATSEERGMADSRELVYWSRGIVVVTTGSQGVAMIGLVNPAAPTLAGVRVGDPLSYLVQQWGQPDQRDRSRLAYKAGKWGAFVVLDTSSAPDRVQSITFGWAKPTQPGAITPPWGRVP